VVDRLFWLPCRLVLVLSAAVLVLVIALDAIPRDVSATPPDFIAIRVSMETIRWSVRFDSAVYSTASR